MAYLNSVGLVTIVMLFGAVICSGKSLYDEFDTSGSGKSKKNTITFFPRLILYVQSKRLSLLIQTNQTIEMLSLASIVLYFVFLLHLTYKNVSGYCYGDKRVLLSWYDVHFMIKSHQRQSLTVSIVYNCTYIISNVMWWKRTRKLKEQKNNNK